MEKKLKNVKEKLLKLNNYEKENIINCLSDSLKLNFNDLDKVYNPCDIFNIIKYKIGFRQKEHLYLILLNAKNEVIYHKIESIGTDNETLFCIKNILKTAILNNGKGIVIAHNHPSGDVTPSNQDVNVTEKLKKACDVMDIELVDHLVISNDDYTSFRKLKIIKF